MTDQSTTSRTKLRARVGDRINKLPPSELASLTRGLEFAFDNGNRNEAHALVDAFFNRHVKNKKTLELGDPVSMLVSPQLATILEGAGYLTINAVLYAKPEEIKALDSLGEGRFEELLAALKANGFVKSTSVATKFS